jgi:hypothetical protein
LLAAWLPQIKEVQGLPFLAEVKLRWEDYNKSTQMIRDILMVRAGGSRQLGLSYLIMS